MGFIENTVPRQIPSGGVVTDESTMSAIEEIHEKVVQPANLDVKTCVSWNDLVSTRQNGEYTLAR
jgi:hypothetical protein